VLRTQALPGPESPEAKSTETPRAPSSLNMLQTLMA
jgi:hypothetical protein